MKNRRVEPAAGVADVNFSRLFSRRWRRGARQARDIGLLQAREGRKMQRLKLRWRLGVGVAVAPFVIALEGGADFLGVFQSRHRDFDVMTLAAVTHLGVALEEYLAGAKLDSKRRSRFGFH